MGDPGIGKRFARGCWNVSTPFLLLSIPEIRVGSPYFGARHMKKCTCAFAWGRFEGKCVVQSL